MTQQYFKLSAVCTGHEADVKAVVAPSDDILISCSRDKTVRSWSRNAPNAFSEDKVFMGHSHFVNSLAFLKPTEDNPNGLIVSGSSDKTINLFDPERPNEPVYSLVGHSDNVCALAVTADGDIVSGSWDKTARVWKNWQCAYTLEGHTHAVWAVLGLDGDAFVTGSADKTIRLWRGGKCGKTLTGHTDCVRGLVEVKGRGFLSCSNDATLRLWTLSGECIQELSGHSSFVYSIALLPTQEFVSSGEDRSVRVWKDGQLVQTILQPCTSIWSVAVSPAGDIVVGGSDGVVRIFTRSESRVADDLALKAYDDVLASHALPTSQIGDINKEKLPGPEALERQGKKDQDVIMIRNGNTVEAHQWSQAEGQWQKVGEVVDAVGQNRKQLHDGKEYDYVFDVDIRDDAPPLKLPYNVTENPYTVAQRFIEKNELPQSYLDQVANFITANAEGITLGGKVSSVDPYTGGSRYAPGLTNSAATPTTYVDPFTGGGAYRPGNAAPVQPAAPSLARVIPVKSYLTFQQANLSAIRKKVLELNEELLTDASKPKTLMLDDDEKRFLDKAVRCIEAKTEADAEIWTVIEKIVIHWPVEKRFPGLDLLRLVCLTSPPASFGDDSGSVVDAALRAIGRPSGSGDEIKKEHDVNMMLALRTVANCFETVEGRRLMARDEVVQKMISFLNENWEVSSNKNARQAMATVALNYSVLASEPVPSGEEIAMSCVSFLVEHLANETDSETLFRGMVAVGTFVKAFSSAKEAAMIVGGPELVRKMEGSAEERIRSVARELKELVR